MVEECKSIASSCSGTRSFSLASTTQLEACITPKTGTPTCAVGAFNGLEVFSPDGSLLVGCINGATCPSFFPITFLDGATAQHCRASLAASATCAATVTPGGATFPVPIYK